VLSAASPVLRHRLRVAAAELAATAGGRLQLRLSDSVERRAFELALDFAYSQCALLPASSDGAPLGDPQGLRQQLRLLARALQMAPLAALCAARLPLPGERLARLAPDYAAAALAPRAVLLPLPLEAAAHGGERDSSDRVVGSCAGLSPEPSHEPIAAELLAGHRLSVHIPRELAPAFGSAGAAAAGSNRASDGQSSGDPFVDEWLACPVPARANYSASASPPRVLLLPVHRLLLAARCPYLAAATSARWGADAPGGGRSPPDHRAARPRRRCQTDLPRHVDSDQTRGGTPRSPLDIRIHAEKDGHADAGTSRKHEQRSSSGKRGQERRMQSTGRHGMRQHR
jgi:hypothetical protein